MRQVVMNGPTLVPQGQLSSQPPHQNGASDENAPPPPPGLRSPLARPAGSNGYTLPQVGQQRNGYHLESTTVSLNVAPSVPEGTDQEGAGQQSPVGWSARYSSTEVVQPPPRPPQNPSTPQNPFLNSFEQQRPSSSSHATYKISSPTKTHLSTSAQVGRNIDYGPVPQANGTSAHHRLPPTTPQLPSCSPIKHQSSPPMPPVQTSPSSPKNHPLLHQNAPSSPGFSPTKQSPPRSFATAEITSTPVIPPVESLSPRPQVYNPPPPVKTANGDLHPQD